MAQLTNYDACGVGVSIQGGSFDILSDDSIVTSSDYVYLGSNQYIYTFEVSGNA